MKSALLALIAALSLPVAAEARTIAALTGDATLVHIDPDTRRATRTVTITGVDAPIAGIDVRPADGMLYALTFSGAVFTIDPMTGTATRKSQLRVAPSAAGAVTVDFNPVANRLRIISADGANLRANVDNGDVTADQSLRFAEGNESPRVIAGAYTNAVNGATETTLFDIDAAGRLLRQAPPNDGVLNVVGALGASPSVIAFDIVTTGATNEGWAIAGGALHRIDLTTGAATNVGRLRGVRGEVRDIAILP
jgi:DNA-binding beta-propeller fold protein YncE